MKDRAQTLPPHEFGGARLDPRPFRTESVSAGMRNGVVCDAIGRRCKRIGHWNPNGTPGCWVAAGTCSANLRSEIWSKSISQES